MQKLEFKDELKGNMITEVLLTALQWGIPHLSRHMAEYLNEHFPDKWVCRVGPQN
jgi:hypothetical protein